MEQEFYELLESINAAGSLEEVYDLVMDFTGRGLRCNQAGILTGEKAGVMQLAASRGLRAEQVDSLEAALPLPETPEKREAIWVSDIGTGPAPDFIKNIKAQAVGSLAIIPLQAAGALVGLLVLFRAERRQFSAVEKKVAQAAAGQLGLAIRRWRAGEELKRSEERYRMMIEQVKDYAIFSTDLDGRPTMWNEGVERILGFSETEFVGHNVVPVIFTPEDVAAGVPDQELQTAAQKGTASDDRWMRRKDGSRFWAEGITTAIRKQTGPLVGYSKVFRDSTGAWRAQEELRKWEFIFNHAGWAVAAAAPDYVLTLVNPAFAQMHGYSVEELKQAPFSLVLAPESRAELEKCDSERGDYVYESLHQRKDGSVFPVLTHVTAFKDKQDKVLFIAGTFQDITERQRSKQELVELKDRLAVDLSSMTHLQALGARANRHGTDFGSLLGDVLDAAIAIAGADKGNVQIVDRESGALKIVAHRGFDANFLNYFQEVVEQAAACAAAMRARERVIIEDVTTSPLFDNTSARQVMIEAGVRAVQSTPLVGRDGQIIGMVSTHFNRPHRPSENELRFLDLLAQQAADGLERSQAEQALREAKEQLAAANQALDQKVQERTASLNETLNSLETLLYSIAHDLRAPNRAMQGYAYLLINSYAQNLNEQAKFFLHRIAEASLKNESLIRDLLEYGRLVHAELNCEALDPARNVRAVLQGFETEVEEKGAIVEVASEWPKVVANDSALSHVLTNLVANALKYVPQGTHPHIRIFPEPRPDKRTSNGKEWVRLSVRDNGIGVPPEQRESIFKLFQRGSNANTEGTGMGLAIVRKAAERMGGRAGVQINPEGGSTFWIDLRKAAPV